MAKRRGEVVSFNNLEALARVADISYQFAIEAQTEGLLSPDTVTGTYRSRLVGWLRKLHLLRAAGFDWTDIRHWTHHRWDDGHEDERRWPRGFAA